MKIILITLDAVRYDTFSKYFNPQSFDYMYMKLFRNVYASSSWTLPSMIAMLSGTYPFTYNNPLSAKRIPNLIDFLRKKKYKTIIINSGNAFLELGSIMDLFDVRVAYDIKSYDKLIKAYDIKKKIKSLIRNQLMNRMRIVGIGLNMLNLQIALAGVYATAILGKQPYIPFDTVSKTIKEYSEYSGNVFILAHVMDAHHPWCALQYFKDEILELLLATAIKYFDTTALPSKYLSLLHRVYETSVKILSSKLIKFLVDVTDLSKNDDVTIIITADHGEGFGYYNKYDRFHEIYKLDKRIYTLFQDQLHIPLIIATNIDYVEDKLKSVSDDTLISNIDILSFILYILFKDAEKILSKYTDSIITLENSQDFEERVVLAETPAYRVGFKWYSKAISVINSDHYKLSISPFLGFKLTNIQKDREELHHLEEKDVLNELYNKLININRSRRRKAFLTRLSTLRNELIRRR